MEVKELVQFATDMSPNYEIKIVAICWSIDQWIDCRIKVCR